jgi:hypothetical protein
MKTLFRILMVLVMGLALTGCVTGKVLDANGNVDWAATIDQSEVEIKAGAGIATSVVLLSVQEDSDRASLGTFAYRSARDVLKVVESGVSLGDLVVVVNRIVADSQFKDSAVVGHLLQSCITLVERQLHTKFSDAEPLVKIKASTALVRAVCRGIMDATVSFAPPSTADAWTEPPHWIRPATEQARR